MRFNPFEEFSSLKYLQNQMNIIFGLINFMHPDNTIEISNFPNQAHLII